jgi:hypothetical protein
LSIDNNDRQRGSDEPDAPLLLQGDDGREDGDVVIRAEQRNQADDDSGNGLEQPLRVQAEQARASVREFWRGWICSGWSRRRLQSNGSQGLRP